jgi:sRNA-binding regulator protein Hfq
MVNSSLIPVPGDKHLRVAEAQSPAPLPKVPATLPTPAVTGPRKLVRPKLPGRALNGRFLPRRVASPLTAHHSIQKNADASRSESSHAEVFYFQKQIQTQTLMTFVLDDGESIEGYIEWYDRDVIKVRHGGRTLIYKSCIKYLYKSGENQRPPI